MKWGLYTLFLIAATLFVSCGDDKIVIGEVDEFPYQSANESYALLKHQGSVNDVLNVDVRNNDARNVFVKLTKAGENDITVNLSIDPSLVSVYNKTNFTHYELFPANLVSIDNNGTVNIAKWRAESEPVAVHFTKDNTLEGNTYLLPIRANAGSNVNISAEGQVIYYVINVAKPIPSSAKSGWDGVSICYVEVNSNSPLNVGTYTLKDSGKPFFDICNIFAANLNYNAETGKPYLYFNDNVQHLLANRDKYIKPLQDKGIKVCLSILPNHGGVGLLNMTNAAAKEFAMEIKAAIDAYGLDGADFDEEWADYGNNGLPAANTTSYGRLLFEVRKLLPKPKLITVYYIGVTSAGLTNPVEGLSIGEIIDYSYYPYYNSYSTSYTAIGGLTKAQWGPYPYAFHGTNGSTVYPAISTTNINNLKNNGYGVNLMYDLRGYSETHANDANKGIMDYSDRLTIFSRILYGEDVVAGEIFLKDW
jgi:hypothetical protein